MCDGGGCACDKTILDLNVCEALCMCTSSGSLREKVEERMSNLHPKKPRPFHWGYTIDDHQFFGKHRAGQVG